MKKVKLTQKIISQNNIQKIKANNLTLKKKQPMKNNQISNNIELQSNIINQNNQNSLKNHKKQMAAIRIKSSKGKYHSPIKTSNPKISYTPINNNIFMKTTPSQTNTKTNSPKKNVKTNNIKIINNNTHNNSQKSSTNYSSEKKVMENKKIKYEDIEVLNNDIFLKKILGMFVTLQQPIDKNSDESNYNEEMKILSDKISGIILNNNINNEYILNTSSEKLINKNIKLIQTESKIRYETYKTYFTFIFEILEKIKLLAKKQLEEENNINIRNENPLIKINENNQYDSFLNDKSNTFYRIGNLEINGNSTNSNFISSINEDFYQKFINGSKSFTNNENTIRMNEDNENDNDSDESIIINNFSKETNSIVNKNSSLPKEQNSNLNKSKSKKIFLVHPNQILESMGITKIKHRYSSSLRINKKEQLDNPSEEKKNELKQSADDNKKSKCYIF
jgi:hypothetical protein